jgi:hypothetical protein
MICDKINNNHILILNDRSIYMDNNIMSINTDDNIISINTDDNIISINTDDNIYSKVYNLKKKLYSIEQYMCEIFDHQTNAKYLNEIKSFNDLINKKNSLLSHIHKLSTETKILRNYKTNIMIDTLDFKFVVKI